jgi:RimJ/RimL family protein N-acetyltransferase
MSTTALEETFQIHADSQLTPEAIALLEKVVWGTEGARYTLTDIEPTLRHLPDAAYITMMKDQKLIGLRLYLEKQARFDRQPLHSFYHSFFAIDPAEKGKGYGKKLAMATIETLRRKLNSKGLLYCHVEKDNLQSLRIAKSLKYDHAGNFSAMTFSRFFPKSSARLQKLPPDQKSIVLKKLDEQYAGHALTDFASSLQTEQYYVLASEGRLLAGAQVESQRWKIHSLAGAGGAVALHALPRIPLLRDLFNPKDFHFLKFGNIFFEPGHSNYGYELFEAVLFDHGLKTAMMFWDKESPVYNEIAAAGRFGLLNALTETPVHVMALFQGFENREMADFKRRPKVISPSDL